MHVWMLIPEARKGRPWIFVNCFFFEKWCFFAGTRQNYTMFSSKTWNLRTFSAAPAFGGCGKLSFCGCWCCYLFVCLCVAVFASLTLCTVVVAVSWSVFLYVWLSSMNVIVIDWVLFCWLSICTYPCLDHSDIYIYIAPLCLFLLFSLRDDVSWLDLTDRQRGLPRPRRQTRPRTNRRGQKTDDKTHKTDKTEEMENVPENGCRKPDPWQKKTFPGEHPPRSCRNYG